MESLNSNPSHESDDIAANSVLENEVHGTHAKASKRLSSGRDGVGQQASPGRYPTTAMSESDLERLDVSSLWRRTEC